MQFIDRLATQDRERCLRVLSAAGDIRTHRELLGWLQCADMQELLPHDIVLVAWGDLRNGAVQFDVVSAIEGIRTATTAPANVVMLAQQLFLQWTTQLHPCPVDANLVMRLFPGVAGTGRCAWVHALCDRRTGQDSCYVVVSTKGGHARGFPEALAALLPHIDTGFRQVTMLQPTRSACRTATTARRHSSTAALPPFAAEQITLPSSPQVLQTTGMTEREQQIMRWVEMGKTNHEIGAILDISAFTVKNHLQRIFKKLDVYSRAQAVSRFKDSMLYG
jgi:transcriptional regulator EpsA